MSEGSSIAKLPPRKRKKRRNQLREAQRRRRARIKEEQMTFLQLVLEQKTTAALREYSQQTGKPIRICAVEIIQEKLGITTKATKPAIQEVVPVVTAVLAPNAQASIEIDQEEPLFSEVSEPIVGEPPLSESPLLEPPLSEPISTESVSKMDQLDLFF